MIHIVYSRAEILCYFGINFPRLLRLLSGRVSVLCFLAPFNNGLCICECSSSTREPPQGIELCFLSLNGGMKRCVGGLGGGERKRGVVCLFCG